MHGIKEFRTSHNTVNSHIAGAVYVDKQLKESGSLEDFIRNIVNWTGPTCSCWTCMCFISKCDKTFNVRCYTFQDMSHHISLITSIIMIMSHHMSLICFVVTLISLKISHPVPFHLYHVG